MNTLASSETSDVVVMGNDLAGRKRKLLRGNGVSDFSRADVREERREERNAVKTLHYERGRFLAEDIESIGKNGLYESHRERKQESSKSNYSIKTANALSQSASSSLSPAPDYPYEHSNDSADNSVGLSNIDTEGQQQIPSTKDIVISGVLIALIIMLFINMLLLLYKPVVGFFRRRFRRFVSENQTLIERRYKTVDKWLIHKTVQPHDDTCNNIRHYTRLKTGESSLGRHTCTVDSSDPSPPSHPPLCLTTSFDTNTTREYSSSSSTSSSCSDGNGTDDLVSEFKLQILEYNENEEGNHPIAATKVSETLDSQSNDTISNILHHKEFKNATITNEILSISSITSPKEVENQSEDDRREVFRCGTFPSTPTRNNGSGVETKPVQVPSVFLTREQVFEKIEILKSKPKPKPPNAGKTTPPTVEENHDDKGDSGCSFDEQGNDEEPKQECSICMEEFQVGDHISFSPAAGCHHVFHHDCLRQWLLRKKGCPCCRVIMLPIDRPNPNDGDGDNDDHDNDGDNTEAIQPQEQQPPHDVPRTTAHAHPHRRHWNRRMRRQFLRSHPAKIIKPWYHKNESILRERLHKKCGTYCCVTCGVVVLKTDLREDLCTKAPPPSQSTGVSRVEI